MSQDLLHHEVYTQTGFTIDVAQKSVDFRFGSVAAKESWLHGSTIQSFACCQVVKTVCMCWAPRLL